MISNNCNTFLVDGGMPRKMDGTHHAHDAVYRPFFRGIPPSTKKNYYSHSLTHFLIFEIVYNFIRQYPRGLGWIWP